jgi:hypothetical protein
VNELVVRVDDLEFRAESREAEPRVLDLDLAVKVGLAQKYGIRRTIQRAIVEGLIKENEDFRVFASGAKTGRPGVSYELTRRGALKVITRLNTQTAIEMTCAIVDAFLQAATLLRAPALPVGNAVDRYLEGAVRVDEHPLLRTVMAEKILFTAWRISASRQKVAGEVRRLMKTNSEYAILVDRAPHALSHLDALASGRLLLAKSTPRDSRQLRMFAS